MKSDISERTFEFVKRVVKLREVLDEKPGVSRALARQVIRSGTSIGANVEEGQSSKGRANFVSKYSIAFKETRETHFWLRLIMETGLLRKERLESLKQECRELIAILTTRVKKLRRKPIQTS